ncbi:MAG: DUF1127 domain-containing protein [Rhodospirillales bacterium]
MTQNIQTLGSLAAADPRGSALLQAVDALFAWIERVRSRRELASLNDHLLKDVGLSRADIQGEIDKPFWKR